jgi:4'-phosphopantetheinyl transferase
MERKELTRAPLWRESRAMNVTCRQPIDELIRTVPGPPAGSEHVAAWAVDCGQADLAQVSILSGLASLPQRPPCARGLFLWFGAPGAERSDQLLPHLAPDERERAARFRLAEDSWSYAAAHAGLRAILSAALGIAAMEIGFVVGPKGKPRLDPARHGRDAARAVEFNISHARGLVAVACAANAVGVDVERRHAMDDMIGVTGSVFAAESNAALEAADGAVRIDMFFRFWSLGEAFIKATGEGIGQGLKSFAFTADGVPRLLRVDGSVGPAERWRFGTL